MDTEDIEMCSMDYLCSRTSFDSPGLVFLSLAFGILWYKNHLPVNYQIAKLAITIPAILSLSLLEAASLFISFLLQPLLRR